MKERVYHLYFFHFFLAPETLYHISLRSFGEFGESGRASISVSTTGKNNFLLEHIHNRINGVMVSMLTLNTVNHGFEPRFGSNPRL